MNLTGCILLQRQKPLLRSISGMATVGSLQAVKEGEEDEEEAEEEEVKEEGAREFEEEVKEEGANELEGEATGEKVVVERKKNRWFAKLVLISAHFYTFIFFKLFPR